MHAYGAVAAEETPCGRVIALRCLFAVCVLLVLARLANAQTTQWDAQLSNTHWYVPVPNIISLAALNSNSFTTPPPVVAGDQTLWSLGKVTNGTFTGVSTATLFLESAKFPKLPSASIASTSLMSGSISPSGAIRIVFTDPANGEATLGVGRMQALDGVPLMEMQMITGTGLLLTHWAYMAPYDPANFSPPSASRVSTAYNTSPQWAWTAGTPWRITSPALFGTNAPGKFIITQYGNGYFLGQGVGPAGSPVRSFTQLGSITPEGAVLFNTVSGGTLTSLLGQISGNGAGASIAVSGYGFSGNDFAQTAFLSLIPPYANAVAASGNPAALGAAARLYAISGTENGLFGPMAQVTSVLDDLSGPALSNAVSQTLPVLNGAGSQATAGTQRTFGQLVQARQSARKGLAATDGDIATRDAWGTTFGRWASQGGVQGVAGYTSNAYGVAGGIDCGLSSRFNVGAAIGFSNNALTGEGSAASGSLNVNSYQLGAYGQYAFAGGVNWSSQADVGIHSNTSSRSIGFSGATASANYFSSSAHIGTGLSRTFALHDKTLLTPSVRLDYLAVWSPSYTESGAGVLNLAVNEQAYQELLPSIDVRIDQKLTPNLTLSANAGAGYNLVNDRVRITASFAGGGDPFDTNGLQVSPWLAHGGLGVSGMLASNVELAVRYDAQTSPTAFVSQSASAKLKISF